MRIPLPVNEQAILRAFCYSDIFDYPLSREEIEKYQISNTPASVILASEERAERQMFQPRLTVARPGIDSLLKKKIISYVDGHFCLKGREEIIPLRKKREEIGKKKLHRAKKIARLIAFIPTVELIGISGSVATNNAKEDDDIDFFIITQEHALWTTRILIILLLHIIGVRRKRKLKKFSNKICVNMFMDNCNLLLPKNRRNIFAAHEIVQMKNIFIRNNMYNKFVQSNVWIKKYLPNARVFSPGIGSEKKTGFIASLFHCFIVPFEKSAKWIQLIFINKHKTTEFISDTLLAFHPHDKTPFVLKSYNKRLKHHGIPI